MKLEDALKGMGDAQDKLRNATAIISPVIMSEQMMRLSQYAGAVDEVLAECEKEYEIKLNARILQHYNDGMKVSPAETMAKMEMAEEKGQILYLTRLVNSAWRQVNIAQSRVNHLRTEMQNNI